MNTSSEELYLEAEADIKNNNYAEAFKKYESILYDEPASAPAHNSLGWLYKTQFDDYVKAENHFLTAMRGDELNAHLEKCLKVRTIEKSWVYGRYALIEEQKLNFDKAIYFFEKAILSSQ